MNAIIITAVNKAIGKLAKSLRNELPLGEHKVSARITLDVDGTLKVGAEESYIPTTSIPFKTALALFVHHAGVTGPAAGAALRKAMTEAIEFERLDKTERAEKIAAIQAITDLESAEKSVQGLVESLPLASRAGKVNGTVNVTVTGVEVTS